MEFSTLFSFHFDYLHKGKTKNVFQQIYFEVTEKSCQLPPIPDDVSGYEYKYRNCQSAAKSVVVKFTIHSDVEWTANSFIAISVTAE